MKLVLERTDRLLTCTIGSLFIDDRFECFTLEDVDREVLGVPVQNWKVKGKTAIPCGTYRVSITFSNRFQRYMPQILNVPGFDGIRIHAGNTDADTEGCPLVGTQVSGESLTESRKAYNKLYSELESAIKRHEDISIEIRRAYE